MTWRRNEPVAARRRCTLLVSHKDDGSWAPLATDFTGSVFIRLGGIAWVAAIGTLTNTGIDGEWVYEATQAETDQAATEIAVRVDDGTYYGYTLAALEHGDINELAVVTDGLTRDDLLRGIFTMDACKMLGVDAVRAAGGNGDVTFYKADGVTPSIVITYSTDGRPTVAFLDLT